MHNIWLDARKQFLPFEGVVGVGYGPKHRKGKLATRYAVIVLVEKKLPRQEIPKGQFIPPAFKGLPTDVREPRLTPPDASRGKRGGQTDDFCLTDYQWLDAMKIHRMRLDQTAGAKPSPPNKRR